MVCMWFVCGNVDVHIELSIYLNKSSTASDTPFTMGMDTPNKS